MCLLKSAALCPTVDLVRLRCFHPFSGVLLRDMLNGLKRFETWNCHRVHFFWLVRAPSIVKF